MKFSDSLQEGLFLKRYKRFFADIQIGEETITAHCPNTGSMKGCQPEKAPCLFSTSDNPKRKLPYTLEMIKTPTSWVGLNTSLTNKLVYEAWENQTLKPHWSQWDRAQREVKINDSTRLDLVLWNSQKNSTEKIKNKDIHFLDPQCPRFHFVEIKNVSLVENQNAYFPDAVTTRGQKHLQELIELIEAGHTGEIFFVVQRTDAKSFSPADDIDPDYGHWLRTGQEKGLKISAYPCSLSPQEVVIENQPLDIVLE